MNTRGAKDLQETHREYEAKYPILADNTYDWEFWLSPEGQYHYVSPSSKRITGYDAKEFLSDPELGIRLIHPEDMQLFKSHASNVENQIGMGEVEFRIFCKDGQIKWISHVCHPIFNKEGQYIGIRGSNRDVTDRKETEEALRRREEFLNKVLMSSLNGIYIYDIKKGMNIFINPQYTSLTGYTIENINSMRKADFFDLFHREDQEKITSHMKAIMNAGDSDVLEIEYRFKRSDGRWIWCLSRDSVFMRSEDDTVCQFIGTFLDITGRKRAEEALLKVNEDLELRVQERTAELREREQQLINSNKELECLKKRLQAENLYLQEEIRLNQNFKHIIGESDAIKRVLAQIEQVSSTDATVLILGETGTGKELIARALHANSLRNRKPLIKLDCASIPPTLIESEFFGHEKGAFTGATKSYGGRFALADRGTIFLDEIGELPKETQAKLLRVIQDGEYEPVGSSKTRKVDMRVIAATNRNLWKAVQEGDFRMDLYYRLSVFPIKVPALRERDDDIPKLASFFAERFAQKMGKKIGPITKVSVERLLSYDWPGNVRELQNVIERAVINSQGGGLDLERLVTETASNTFEATEEPNNVLSENIMTIERLHQLEQENIIRALKSTGWIVSGKKGAARLLGMPASTLSSRMNALEIKRPR